MFDANRRLSAVQHTHTHTHTHTMSTANKNRARNAVKENSSGAAGQPWTSFGLLINDGKVQIWTVGTVQRQGTPVPLPANPSDCTSHTHTHTDTDITNTHTSHTHVTHTTHHTPTARQPLPPCHTGFKSYTRELVLIRQLRHLGTSRGPERTGRALPHGAQGRDGVPNVLQAVVDRDTQAARRHREGYAPEGHAHGHTARRGLFVVRGGEGVAEGKRFCELLLRLRPRGVLKDAFQVLRKFGDVRERRGREGADATGRERTRPDMTGRERT